MKEKWERIGDMDLWRFAVPGGWLYMGAGSANERSMAFVPRPTGPEGLVEELVSAARAGHTLARWVEERSATEGFCIVCMTAQVRAIGAESWPHKRGCVFETALAKSTEALA